MTRTVLSLSAILFLFSAVLFMRPLPSRAVFAQGPDIAALAKTIEDLDSRVERQRLALQTLQEVTATNNSATTQLSRDVTDLRAQAFTQIDRMVPIGAILPYYGKPEALPANWVLCLGQDTPGQPYPWTRIPDLRQRFLRGTAVGNSGELALGGTGGLDYVSGHQHNASGTSDDVSFPIESIDGFIAGNHPVKAAVGADYDNDFVILEAPSSGSNPRSGHGHSGGSATFSGHTSNDGAHDNRPAFTSVYFIIRIK